MEFSQPSRSRGIVTRLGLRSPLYQNAMLYEAVMAGLYGRTAYLERFQAVAKFIESGNRVLDVCAGPCRLAGYVKKKGATYTAYDLSPFFVERGIRRGIDIQLRDIASTAIPSGAFDVVVLQSSLYQFIPEEQRLLSKLLHATPRLILTEPVQNVSSSAMPWLQRFSRWFTEPEKGDQAYLGKRFSEETLKQALEPYREWIVHENFVGGFREKLYVLDKQGRGAI